MSFYVTAFGKATILKTWLCWTSKIAGFCYRQKYTTGTSLVAQWLRICMPMPGTGVQSLVQEDSTCHGATKAVCYNFWRQHTLEPVLHNKRSHHNGSPHTASKEWPPLAATRESLRAAAKTHHSDKEINEFLKKKKKKLATAWPRFKKNMHFNITGQEKRREKFTGRQGSESECPCGSGDLRQGSGWGESRGTVSACSSNGPWVVLMGIQDWLMGWDKVTCGISQEQRLIWNQTGLLSSAEKRKKLGEKPQLGCHESVCAQSPSHVQLFVTPKTATQKTPLSMGFSRQDCWSGLPFPLPGDIPDPGIEPLSPASPEFAGRFFTTEAPGNPVVMNDNCHLRSLCMPGSAFNSHGTHQPS